MRLKGEEQVGKPFTGEKGKLEGSSQSGRNVAAARIPDGTCASALGS